MFDVFSAEPAALLLIFFLLVIAFSGQSFDSAGYDDSYDNDSRVRTLEQRMAQTVEILAHSMSRMEKNILALADSDPLRRSGVNISTTHDARLNSVMNAYNTSSTRAAKKKTQVCPQTNFVPVVLVCHACTHMLISFAL